MKAKIHGNGPAPLPGVLVLEPENEVDELLMKFFFLWPDMRSAKMDLQIISGPGYCEGRLTGFTIGWRERVDAIEARATPPEQA